MGFQLLRFFTLYRLLVVEWLYGFPSLFTGTGPSRKGKRIDMQGGLDILLKMRFSSVAERVYTIVYGKTRIKYEFKEDASTTDRELPS